MKSRLSAHFSRWASWGDREILDGLHLPGVYALAISEISLAGKPFSFRSDVVYFGMTNAASGLRGRLGQFQNTIRGKSGHGGADRFRYDFPRFAKLEPVLYVAVLSVKCSVTSNSPRDLLQMGRVAMKEYECFAQHVRIHGKLPKYNDKKNAPKRAKNQK
jgi:hypothetical protein